MKRFSSITTTQLARICGVSQGTVDRALHDRPGICPETRDRILAVAKEYSYRPAGNRQEGQDRSMLIGVILFDLYNSFFSKLAMSIVQKAKISGYSVIFQFSEKDLAAEKAALDYFNWIGVDGIILFSVGSEEETYANYLRSLRRPVVAVGNRLFDLTYVGIDDVQAAYDLTEKVLERADPGPIVWFSPALRRKLHGQNAQLLRLKGFQQAVEQRGRSWIIARSEEELPSQRGGIVCSTDHYAARVLRYYGGTFRGRLGGFDHVAQPEFTNQPFVTVEYSTDRIAEECMNYFWRRTYHPRVEHEIVSVPEPDEKTK